MQNTGKSIEFDSTEGIKPAISSSALNCTIYELVNFHFHWGLTKGIGSDHRFNNVQYDFEVCFFVMKYFNFMATNFK